MWYQMGCNPRSTSNMHDQDIGYLGGTVSDAFLAVDVVYSGWQNSKDW